MWERVFQNIEWYTLRLLLAAFCGALVGFERKRRHKDAGIRTHVLVAVGAALFSILSEFGFEKYAADDRIAANIVTGVGFLGAGVIFLRGRNITGLTTAAGIWTVAGIGMAAGLGMYALAGMATVLVVMPQFLMHKLFSSHEPQYLDLELLLPEDGSGQTVWDILAEIPDVEVEEFQISRRDDGCLQVKLVCASRDGFDAEQAIQLLQERAEIRKIGG